MSALDIMIEGPLGGAAFNNEFGRPNLCGYFRSFEHAGAHARGRRGARLPQAHHDRRWPGQHPGRARAEGHAEAGGQDRRAGWPGDADRPGRRRGVLDGAGHERGGPRFRLGAARQPGDGAALPGGHRPLLGAGRGQPHPLHPRRGRGRPVQRGAGAHPRQRPGRALRAARGPQRRARHGAGGDLVQRGAGALRAGHRAGGPGALRGPVRARAGALRGAGRCHRGAGAEGDGPAVRQRAHRHADGRAVRQAAAHAPGREVAAAGARRAEAGRAGEGDAGAGARAPDGGGQGLPHHHWRPDGGGPDGARPDGGPVAGAGGGLRGDAVGARRATRARPCPWASARRWRSSTRPPRRAWRWPRP